MRYLSRLKHYFKSLQSFGKNKIFCIGRNKTGTTSMAEALRELGYYVAPQRPAELLLEDWKNKNFKKIINFVRYNGQAFQDIPFSLPETYKFLDRAFPDSKFILTIRDNAEQWYQSVINFQSKLFGKGNVPIKEDLMNADYVCTGWIWKVNRYVYNTPEDDIYNKDIFTRHYEDYNNNVIDYFAGRENKLLIINLKEQDAVQKLTTFLGTRKNLSKMPWKNKTVTE